MKPSFFALMLTLNLNAWAGPSMVERPLLVMGEGEQRLLDIPGLQRFSIGSARVKAIQPPQGPHKGGNPLLLRAIEPGPSDLWVWKHDGTVEHRALQVEKWGNDGLPPTLRTALSRLEEVEILIHPKGVVLTGEVHSLEELKRLEALRPAFSQELTWRTFPSEELLTAGEAKLRGWISHQKPGSHLQVESTENRLRVSGTIDSNTQREWIELKLRDLFPLVDFDWSSSLDTNPTIYFRVFLLELKKDQFTSLGVQWPQSLQGAFQVSPTRFAGNLNLDLNLEMLAQRGMAKILSKPELAVRAPGEAELFAGGEIPIHSRSRFQSSYAWKPFGLTLKLKVQECRGERIRLEISTEVSHLDSSIASDQVPGLRSNRMRTQVDARFGRPLLLSGLLQEDVRRQVRGIPILSEIPILGALFGSKDYLREQSELVAILLPQAVAPTPSLHSVEADYPRGQVPAPRNWVSKRDLESMQKSPDFPWNAF